MLDALGPSRPLAEVEQRLAEIAEALSKISDQTVKRTLLREMRVLIAEADRQLRG